MICAFCLTVGAFRFALNNELVPTSAAKPLQSITSIYRIKSR